MPIGVARADMHAARFMAGADTPKQFADHHNAAGIVASWTLQHLNRKPGPKPHPRHIKQLWEAAKAY